MQIDRIRKERRLVVVVDENKCMECGNCVRACLTGALQLVGGKAKLVDEELCDGFGSCIAACPHDAIRLELRRVKRFNWEVLRRISFNELMAKLRFTGAGGMS